jgi:hypothetical protein
MVIITEPATGSQRNGFSIPSVNVDRTFASIVDMINTYTWVELLT